MTILRSLLVLLALLSAAQAADVVFPAGFALSGSRPPPGPQQRAPIFQGFERRGTQRRHDHRGAAARRRTGILQRSTTAEELKKARPSPSSSGRTRSSPTVDAFLVIAHQEVEKMKLRKWIFAVLAQDLIALVTVQIPDDAAKALSGQRESAPRSRRVAIRSTVPVEEQLGLLPFRVGDLAQFRIGGVIPGRAIMLTDSPTDEPAAGCRYPHRGRGRTRRPGADGQPRRLRTRFCSAPFPT